MADKKEIISASPKVRKLAREFGANIYQIQGSQREGRISEEDVKSFIKESISSSDILPSLWDPCI
jgi:pyruvate dehydrogenase E2 component (dihydrolipoamide acetyltransferase)